jgi:mycothiol system anti-sigma-R factor
MNNCDGFGIKILRYLDKDLEGQELEHFLSHLDFCARCREQLEAEKELSATLHRSRPLYAAPAALRDRIAASVLENVASNCGQDSIYQRPSPAAEPSRLSQPRQRNSCLSDCKRHKLPLKQVKDTK